MTSCEGKEASAASQLAGDQISIPPPKPDGDRESAVERAYRTARVDLIRRRWLEVGSYALLATCTSLVAGRRCADVARATAEAWHWSGWLWLPAKGLTVGVLVYYFRYTGRTPLRGGKWLS